MKKLKDQRRHTVLLCKIKQCSWVSPLASIEDIDEGGLPVPSEAPFMNLEAEDVVNTSARKARRALKQAELHDLSIFLGLPTKNTKGQKEQKKKDKKKRGSRRILRGGNARALAAKIDVLEELCEWFRDNNFRPQLDDVVLKALLDMIAINLFRPLSQPRCPHVRVKAATSRCQVDVVDDPDKDWNVLSLVHRLFASLLQGCAPTGAVRVGMRRSRDADDDSDLDADDPVQEVEREAHQILLWRHLDKRFLARYLETLKSGDDLEREMMTTCLGLMYEYLEDEELRRTLRTAIANTVHIFMNNPDVRTPAVAATQIRSVLQVIFSTITRFGSMMLSYVLTPLYQVSIECLQRYHQELFKCVTLFISRQHADVVGVFRKLVKTWPRQCAFKQLLYLDQIHASFLQIVQHQDNVPPQALPVYKQWYYSDLDLSHLGKVLVQMFKKICECIEGPHYDVSQAAVRIIDHPAVFFPLLLYPSESFTSRDRPRVTGPDSPKSAQELSDLSAVDVAEVRRNPLLPLVYITFRRVVSVHVYLDVRRTLDTLMGLMENRWPLLCEACVAWEEAKEAQTESRDVLADVLAAGGSRSTSKKGCPSPLRHIKPAEDGSQSPGSPRSPRSPRSPHPSRDTPQSPPPHHPRSLSSDSLGARRSYGHKRSKTFTIGEERDMRKNTISSSPPSKLLSASSSRRNSLELTLESMAADPAQADEAESEEDEDEFVQGITRSAALSLSSGSVSLEEVPEEVPEDSGARLS